MSSYWASLLQLDGRLLAATWASWSGVAMQAVAIVVLFFAHGLTPFRVLLIQWPTNGSAGLTRSPVSLLSRRSPGRCHDRGNHLMAELDTEQRALAHLRCQQTAHSGAAT